MKKQKLNNQTVSALSDLELMTAQLDAARAASIAAVLPARPAGAFTAAEYGERHKLSPSTVQGQLKRLIKSGFLIRQKAYVLDKESRLSPTNVYSVKK